MRRELLPRWYSVASRLLRRRNYVASKDTLVDL
nr:MAG TPA_asm: hypothetical protein [Caudoviricetes sp.]DAT96087.1 MAG TPA: hypothetical protein [Caudoviricetes sp.]